MTDVDQPPLAAPGARRPEQPVEVQAPRLDPERWVDEHGDVLFGFAAARVQDPATAQDLVQETFLAALQVQERYAGRATERAWLFGILRNKLVDYYRQRSREIVIADFEATLPEEEGAFHAGGPGKDGWVQRLAPAAWDTPAQSLMRAEFQNVLKSCLARLPEKLAHVFLLREMDGVPTEELCKEMGLSPNNLWVMLHRGRMALRRCLEVHWFRHKRE
jgi:RNA polymerase sigma-70 factor (ECF subfamily)